MISIYKYQTSAAYIENLKFDYMETYSLQRGEEFETKQAERLSEYRRLEARSRRQGLTASEEKAFVELSNVVRIGYLINTDGNLNTSAKKTHSFGKADTVVNRLVALLKIPAIDVPMWMCAPIYRDGVIFYDNSGHIVSTLNICFSCQYMAIGPFSEINADVETYNLLKELFIELGREIEGK